MINPRFAFIISALFVFALLHFFSSIAHAQTAAAQEISKMYGEITLMSNYVEKGLTQSDKNPSLGAELGYGFGGQGRMGVVAYSVKYPLEDVSVSMRIYGEYKFIFTPTAALKVRNDLVRYFAGDSRNNILIKLDQSFGEYHILYEYEDNFEGTNTNRNWFGFRKDWPFATIYQFNVTAGYSMVELPLNNFFDTKIGVSYTTPTFSAGIFNTYTSQAAQFGGQGDMFFLLEVVAKF